MNKNDAVNEVAGVLPGVKANETRPIVEKVLL